MVEITIDSRELAKLDKVLVGIKNGVPKVLVPAINRSLDRGRTTVRREIRKAYLIKQKDIPIKVIGANRNRLGGTIVIKDTMLELGKFSIRPRGVQKRKNKQPLRAQVRVNGGGTLPHAFMTSFGGPFQRVGPERLPIRKLLAIGAAIMASQPAVGPAASKAMGDSMDKQIDHQIKRLLATAGR